MNAIQKIPEAALATAAVRATRLVTRIKRVHARERDHITHVQQQHSGYLQQRYPTESMK